MNDRELLEFAAKAVGLELRKHPWGGVDPKGVGVYHLDTGGIPNLRWNPLTDDGDALRLAVSLRIEVAPESFSKGRVDVRERWGTYLWEMYGDHGDDAQKATRCAIVRVAAEIGRGIK